MLAEDLCILTLHRLPKSIRVTWIKYLIAGHNSNKILRVTEIDDVMGPARYHVDSLDLITTDLKLNFLSCVYVTLLYQTMTVDNYEKLPF